MADELEPVEQQFIAEMAEYIADVQEGAASAQEFAAAADEAKVAVDGLRDSALEAGAAVGDIAAGAVEAADAEGHLRDSALEAGEAMGHVRDEAIEASASVKELGNSADETAAKLDLMGLSGIGTFTSLGPLLGIIGALVVAAAAVAPAVAAMGLGFAAAGAFAIPTIMQITGGLTTISTDTAAVNNAMTATARNTALAKLHKDWAAIPAPIQDVIKAVQQLEGAWKSWAQYFQPETLTAFNSALGIARDLMGEILPLASQGFFAINGALEQIKAGIDSSGFREFLSRMTQMVVPATNAIMRLAGVLLGTLGNALEALLGNSVPFVNFLTVLVQALSGPLITALNLVIGLFLSLMSAVEPLLPGLSQIATVLIQDIGQSFSAFIPIISQVVTILGGSLIKILQDLEPVIANALTPNGPFMMALAQLPHLLNVIMPLITGLASVLSDPWIAQAAVWVISLVVAFRGVVAVIGLVKNAFGLLTAVMELNPFILILTGIALLVVAFIYLWDHCAAFRDFWKDAWHDIAVVFDTVRHAVATGAHDIAVVFDTARRDIAGAFDAVRHAVATAGHDIVAGFDAVINWFKSTWKEIVAWLVDPIGMAVFEIRTHTHQIAQAFDQLRHDVAAIVIGFGHDVEAGFDQMRHNAMAIIDGTRHDIASAFDQIRHDIAAFIDWAPGAVVRGWEIIGHDTLSFLDGVRHDIAAAWDWMGSVTRSMISTVTGFFERLPGQIMSFLSKLPGQMLQIGENVIKGLINGIIAEAGQIPSLMSGLASDVASYFTDPLKLFSPSRLFHEYGFNIVQGAINGVKANAPQLLATMRGLGAGVGAQGLAGSSLAAGAIAPAAGGSTSVHVTVPTTVQGMTSDAYSSPQFQQYMQTQVQEAVLRYGQLNPGNGLTPAWGR